MPPMGEETPAGRRPRSRAPSQPPPQQQTLAPSRSAGDGPAPAPPGRSTSDIAPDMLTPTSSSSSSRKPRSKHRRSLLSRFIGIKECDSQSHEPEITPLWGSRHVDLFFSEFPRERKQSRHSTSSSSSRSSLPTSKKPSHGSSMSPGTSISHDRRNDSVGAGDLPRSTYSIHRDPLAKLAESYPHRRAGSEVAQPVDARTDDTLRHPEMPLSMAQTKGQLVFIRIYRNDGSFGTVAAPLATTADDLLHLAARKFFIGDIDPYHLVCVMPDQVAVLPPHARPFEIVQDRLFRLGYLPTDPLNDVCRKDLTCLCKIILTDHSLMPPSEVVVSALKKRPDRVVLKQQDLLTLPAYMLDTADRVEMVDVSRSLGLHVPDRYWTQVRRVKEFKAVRSNVGNLINLSFLPWLTTLSHLDLSRNALPSIDLDFAKLPHLRAVNLRGNNLKTLPASLGNLELRILYLGTNALTEFPFGMPSVVELDLSYNRITELPQRLGQFKNLERLNIASNAIQKLPDSVGTLPKLIELDVSHNHLDSLLPLLQNRLRTIKATHNFRTEAMHRNSSTVSSMATPVGSPHLGTRLPARLDQLRRLDLSYSRSIRIIPDMRLESVTHLDLQGCMIAALSEEVFGNMPNLESVNLAKNRLSRLPNSLCELPRLSKLSLASNSLNVLPNSLYYLPQLRELDLHANNFKSLPQAARELRRLRVLNLSSNLLESLPSFSLHDLDSSTPSREALSPTGIFPVVSSRSHPSRGPSFDESRRGSAVSALSLDPSDPGPPAPATPAISIDEDHTRPLNSDIFSSSFGEPPVLQEIYLADNRLGDDCFEELSFCTELRILNLSYNEITEIPGGTFGQLINLRELSLSGNRLSTLPQEDFALARSLRSLYINSNKLHTLPAELTKVSELETLDVACNNLRYNVSNWNFEWNWRWNKRLRLLNFSSNRRLEIRRNAGHRNEEDYTDFCVLPNLQILGLMDVTLTTPAVPDQTENCRVRTYGSEITVGRFGVADYLAEGETLSINDLMIDQFMGNKDELLAGVFDGFLAADGQGNRISKLTQEIIPPLLRQELERRRECDSIADCLRRAYLAAHREIGNATMAAKEELSHSFVGQHSTVAHGLTATDREACTGATLVYIKNRTVYVAATGGVRVVVAKANGQFQPLAEPTSVHSDFNVNMMRTGGGLMTQDLINGRFPHNPVIGGFSEGTLMSAAPVISEYSLSDTNDLVIIASEELWDVMPYETAADLARTEARDPMLAALKLRDFALAYGRNHIKQLMVMVCGSAREQYDDSREMFAVSGDKRRARQLLPADPMLARLGDEINPPLGDVAMVFTDIRHSTKLWETLPETVMKAALNVHNAVLRRCMRLMGGYEVKTEGDAFIVSFHTAVEALQWCLTTQQLLLDADWPSEILSHPECAPVYAADGRLLYKGLSVRMGIHCGRAMHDLDSVSRRMDYFGPMVNRTARISAIAAGGQITVSADLLKAVRQESGNPTDEDARRRSTALATCGYRVEELGELKLKGIEMPELIYIIYPGPLKQRHESVLPDADHMVTMPTPPPQSPAPRSSPPATPLPSAAALPPPAGDAAMSMLARVEHTTNRLEHLCAYMRTGVLPSPLPGAGSHHQLEHYVTRIENSIDSLTLQTLAPRLNLHELLDDENFDSE